MTLSENGPDLERMKRFAQRCDQIMIAREGIEKHAGPFKKGSPSITARVDCPVCKGEKTLYYSRASNGHIHAHCKTKYCVSWME